MIGAAAAEEIAQRVGELSRLCEGADEEHVEIQRELLQQILEPGIAHQPNVVPLLLTPHADDLGHDTRQVGVHQSAIEGGIGTLRDEVQNAYAKTAHPHFSCGGHAPPGVRACGRLRELSLQTSTPELRWNS